jgi:hypothetical protein
MVEEHQQTSNCILVQELFEGVRNIRDLAEAHPSIAPGEDTRTHHSNMAASCCVDLMSDAAQLCCAVSLAGGEYK